MNFTRCTPGHLPGGVKVKLSRNFTLHPVGSPGTPLAPDSVFAPCQSVPRACETTGATAAYVGSMRSTPLPGHPIHARSGLALAGRNSGVIGYSRMDA